MMILSTIRLLAVANNERGDLFTRLVKDLFFALGYDDLRLNVHKSGRELDIQGRHRFEPRTVVAECKAHARKMGGEELNKFFGVLTRERHKSAPTPVAGYFLSLSGFTETSIEQEIESGNNGVILMDGTKMVEELERCRAIVGPVTAVERAGQCAQYRELRDARFDGTELLGHQGGYIWVVYYAAGKQRTYFALIHADGTPLAEGIAKKVIESDRLCKGVLHLLGYLAPPTPAPDRMSLAVRAVANYRQWLAEECGYIQLDGLPADTDLSATRLRLERLFVPLKATFLDSDDKDESKPLSIGKILENTSHLALLAMPGGGKSTLLKRLATAYVFPERRREISDDLPQREWLPLVLRCRELRDRAHRPIIELLNDIPRHAGMAHNECDEFQNIMHGALRAGSALLLVDGLDEISDEGARQAFANHLRTFIAMFPDAALVVTSREAGFRLVAGVVSGACKQAKLTPLAKEDVLCLCESWHVEVVGDNEKVRSEARQLGQVIWENERIRNLAENPLLLTTLLVVKRCIQELPRSRTALYREAIRVLVRTWNVEGYAPLDEDETLAQLSYVACSMMEDGKQRIDQKTLLNLLQESRRELEAELQFARISPQQFIERIEYRSSLVMQTGHEEVEGRLLPVYEFRHLTFQEYLAARGYVEEQYAGRDVGRQLADILEPHFVDERWREVIPLAASLAGRKAEHLVRRLIASCEQRNLEKYGVTRVLSGVDYLLRQCIRDEVQVTAPTLRAALREAAREPIVGGLASIFEGFLVGKFAEPFREIVEQNYLSGEPGFDDYLLALVDVAEYQLLSSRRPVISLELMHGLLNMFELGNRLERIKVTLVCMLLAFGTRRRSEIAVTKEEKDAFRPICKAVRTMVQEDDLPCALVGSWAFVWLGSNRLLIDPLDSELLMICFRIWLQNGANRVAYLPAWALASLPLLPRDSIEADAWGDCDQFLESTFRDPPKGWSHFARLAALVVGWYRKAPWSDNEIVAHLKGLKQRDQLLFELLRNLGGAGLRVLNEIEES